MESLSHNLRTRLKLKTKHDATFRGMVALLQQYLRALLPRAKRSVVIEFDRNVVKALLVESNQPETHVPKLKVKILSSDGDDEILAALRSHLREMELEQGASATVLIPRHAVHAKIWRLPGRDREDLRKMVGYRLQKEIPLPLQEIVYDYRVLSEEADGSTRILAVIGRRREIERYLRLCQEGGLEVEAVRLSIEATYLSFLQSCQEFSELETQCVALVDVDFSATNIYVIDRGSLHFCRSVGQGVSELIDRVAGPQRKEAYQAWIDELCNGVVDTIAMIQREGLGSAVEHVWLSGWLPRVRSLSQVLTEKLSIPVYWLDPATLPGRSPNSEEDATPHYWFSVSALLGMKKSRDQSLMDFRPEPVRQKQRRRELIRHGMYAGCLAVYLAVLALATVGFSLHTRESAMKHLQNALDTLRPSIDAINAEEQARQAMGKQLGASELTASVIGQLLEALPGSVELSSLTFSRNESLVLHGLSASLSEVFSMPQQLAQQAAFGEIVITSADRRQQGGGEVVEFGMKIGLAHATAKE